MNLQQLETFRWVAALGSFTQAAKKLNTTQSTISMRISELEQELGVRLLDRTGRMATLTRSGKDLLQHATQIHKEVTEIKAVVANPETITGTIRMSVAELIALSWLPDLVAGLARHYPNIDIELEVGLAGTILDRVVTGEADIGLVPRIDPFSPDLESHLLGTVEFAFMAAPSLDLPTGTLTARDLAGWPLISLGPNAVLSQVEEHWFQAGGAKARKQDRSNSMEISAGLVRSGLGVSFLPVFYYTEDVKAGRMRVIDVDPPAPQISFFCVHTTANVTPIIRKVIDIATGLDGFSGAAPSSVRDI